MSIRRNSIIKIFNSGYIIALLTFLCGSLGSFCDGLIASKTLSVAALAAVGITYPYTKFLEALSKLMSSGSQIIISRKIGQNRFEDVSEVFFSAIVLILLASALLILSVLSFSKALSFFLGAREDCGTLQPTADYLLSLVAGAPAHLLTLYLIPLFQLDQKQKLVNAVTLIMTAVNISLNILFVYLGMGIRGIGYSTSISYYAALLLLCTHFLSGRKGILLRGRLRIRLSYLKEIIREGAPSAFKNATSIISNTFLNNAIAATGSEAAMAAFSLYKMTKFIFLSVSEAICTPVRMVQAILYEENDRKSLKQVFAYSLLKGTILSLVLTCLELTFAKELFSLFISGEVLDEMLIILRRLSVIYIINSIICYYLSYFQVINKKVLVYAVSGILNLAVIPVIAFMAPRYGTPGIWTGWVMVYMSATLFILACACFIGRKSKSLSDKLLALPPEEKNQTAVDYHIESAADAEKMLPDFAAFCDGHIADRDTAMCCNLALEEIVFNILDYQKSVREVTSNIDVHVLVSDNHDIVIRIKDDSRERNPFEKYEFTSGECDFENMGIRMIKCIAREVKYSFVFNVNFITILL